MRVLWTCIQILNRPPKPYIGRAGPPKPYIGRAGPPRPYIGRVKVQDDRPDYCVAAHVYQHRIRPASMVGGAGYFKGYQLPQKMVEGILGAFVVRVLHPDSELVIGRSMYNRNDAVGVKINKDGRILYGSIQYWGSMTRYGDREPLPGSIR